MIILLLLLVLLLYYDSLHIWIICFCFGQAFVFFLISSFKYLLPLVSFTVPCTFTSNVKKCLKLYKFITCCNVVLLHWSFTIADAFLLFPGQSKLLLCYSYFLMSFLNVWKHFFKRQIVYPFLPMSCQTPWIIFTVLSIYTV